MSARVAVLALVVLSFALAAACAHAPRPQGAIGEPVPSASTSAEPLWLRNRP